MTTPRRVPRAHLFLDRLEARTTPTAVLNGNVLEITGTTGNDHVLVTRVGANIRVRENGTTTSFAASGVASILFNGDAGNDRFVSLVNLPTTANGDAGNDFLSTGAAADTLNGGADNDILHGGLGGDTMNGDDGNDTLVAGLDRQVNTLTGGLGRDTLIGSLGNDVLNAGTGPNGETDTDSNWVFGNFGNDTINGGNGNDYLFGNFGADTINGHGGDDKLNGGLGVDTLDGGDGDDWLDGGLDNVVDTLTGGAGNDKFRSWAFLGLKADTQTDFGNGNDTTKNGFRFF